MLKSGKKIRALRDKKKKILTRVVRKKFLNETKNHNHFYSVKTRAEHSQKNMY